MRGLQVGRRPRACTVQWTARIRVGRQGRRLGGDVSGRKIRSRWRTAPLWGLGYRLRIEPVPTFLHDGRARSVEEAILWHAGEAQSTRQTFEHLSAFQGRQLLRWIEAL
jgi:CxxC motif-containing protein (DUF1111 family)